MPKMKTHKGSKKRFRVTANGKLKRHQACKKHLLSHKTGKRKRHLRGDRHRNRQNGQEIYQGYGWQSVIRHSMFVIRGSVLPKT